MMLTLSRSNMGGVVGGTIAGHHVVEEVGHTPVRLLLEHVVEVDGGVCSVRGRYKAEL